MNTQLAATPNAESSIQREINMYRASPILPKTVDVLNFWRDNAKNYPMLVKVVTPKRSNLDPENVNMLVYLRENLGKVQLDR
jgi:uncharacterized protein involved in exopolysaccharide biosynthesis